MAKSKSRTKKVLDDEDDLQVKKSKRAEPEEAEEATELDAEEAEAAEIDDEAQVTELADDDEEVTELAGDDDEPQIADDEDDEPQVADDDEDEDLQVKRRDDDDGDADAADDDGDEDRDEDSVDERPAGPVAKITTTTLVFIILNWIAAPTFLYFAFMDHTVRVQYAHRTFLNYVQLDGLPLKEEENAPSASNETRPRLRLSDAQLIEAVKDRTRKSFKDFRTVEESIPVHIRPSDMTRAVLADIYSIQGLTSESEWMPTLDDEIQRLKTDVPNQIANAAKEVKDAFAAKKDDEKRKFIREVIGTAMRDADQMKRFDDLLANSNGANLDDLVKRALVHKTLLPIAYDVWQVRALDKKLASVKGADLDSLVDDSIQRRMYYDILAPLGVFRPGDVKDAKTYKIEKLADQTYSLKQVQEFMTERLQEAIADNHTPANYIGEPYTKDAPQNAMVRTSIEKREVIGFILFALSQATVPTLDKKLYPQGIERAQVVSGLYQFTSSSIYYVQALQILQERILEGIVADREGYLHPQKADPTKLTSTVGFAAAFELEIDRLVKIAEHIDAAQKRLDDLKSQRGHFQKIHDQRVKQRDEIFTKLLAARGKTEESVKELREFQQQLHNALLELSDAGDRNFRLEAQIRAIEEGLQKKAGKKGGKN